MSETMPETIFGYPEAICDKEAPSKPEVSQRNNRVNKPLYWLKVDNRLVVARQ